MKVTRTNYVVLNPRAECLGDNPDPDAPSNCPMSLRTGRDVVNWVKAHVKVHPTHQVVVVHETRSLYEATQ